MDRLHRRHSTLVRITLGAPHYRNRNGITNGDTYPFLCTSVCSGSLQSPRNSFYTTFCFFLYRSSSSEVSVHLWPRIKICYSSTVFRPSFVLRKVLSLPVLVSESSYLGGLGKFLVTRQNILILLPLLSNPPPPLHCPLFRRHHTVLPNTDSSRIHGTIPRGYRILPPTVRPIRSLIIVVVYVPKTKTRERE